MDTNQLDKISLGDSVSNVEDIPVNIDKDSFNIFLKNAKKFWELEEEIDEIQSKLTLLKKESKSYYKELDDYMNENKLPNYISDKGEIQRVVKMEKERMNNKIMKSKLSEYFKSNEQALECFKFLENREKIEKSRLKIIKKKSI